VKKALSNPESDVEKLSAGGPVRVSASAAADGKIVHAVWDWTGNCVGVLAAAHPETYAFVDEDVANAIPGLGPAKFHDGICADVHGAVAGESSEVENETAGRGAGVCGWPRSWDF